MTFSSTDKKHFSQFLKRNKSPYLWFGKQKMTFLLPLGQ